MERGVNEKYEIFYVGENKVVVINRYKKKSKCPEVLDNKTVLVNNQDFIISDRTAIATEKNDHIFISTNLLSVMLRDERTVILFIIVVLEILCVIFIILLPLF